jgi:hypothetical protein
MLNNHAIGESHSFDQKPAALRRKRPWCLSLVLATKQDFIRMFNGQMNCIITNIPQLPSFPCLWPDFPSSNIDILSLLSG